nr:MAG TPA: hypothetical protein [Bacteriophage sp.]
MPHEYRLAYPYILQHTMVPVNHMHVFLQLNKNRKHPLYIQKFVIFQYQFRRFL